MFPYLGRSINDMPNKRLALLGTFCLCALIFSSYQVFIGDDDEAQIYVLITIDTERDLPPYYDTYTGIDEGMPILCDLLDAHNVKATFFVTGNVALERPEAILSISERHEIGCHGLYHEEHIDELSYEEKEMMVVEATNILTTLIGRDISSFRTPYHHADTELYLILEEQGYDVEASAYNGPDMPYHPSVSDWCAEGDMRLLHIPVTHVDGIFYPFNTYPESWITLFERAVDGQSGDEPIIIVIGLHPWELVGQSFYPILFEHERPCGQYTIEQLAALLEYLDKRNVSYMTMEEAYESFSW